VVDCLTVAAGILARSQEVIKGTGADQRFVKNALKICVLPPIYDKYLFLASFCLIQIPTTTFQTTNQNFYSSFFPPSYAIIKKAN